MEKLKQEIQRIRRHRLDYYNSHLDMVENHLDEKPDISIETCKALIEGVSKLSLHLLDQEPLSNLNNKKLNSLVKSSLTRLQEGPGFSDIELCKRISSAVHYIGEVRNEHCDIGHGRASLKEQVNDTDFADLVIQFTDAVCTYMLRRLDLAFDGDLEYDENPDFNDFLDDLNPLPGKTFYSRALFDQETETYAVQLENYKDSLELDES